MSKFYQLLTLNSGTRDVDDPLLVFFFHHRAIYPVRNNSGGDA